MPKVDAALPGGMDLLRIYDDEDLRSLPSGVWGIKEPTFQHRDASRMKGLYPPFIVRSISTSTFTDGDDDGRGAATATDEDSTPLDVILIPGEPRSFALAEIYAFFP